MSLENFAIEYRKTMSSFATGVTVVTTLDENEFIHGMTANSFTSVSLDPPTVLVCIGHSAEAIAYGLGSFSPRDSAIISRRLRYSRRRKRAARRWPPGIEGDERWQSTAGTY